MKRKVMLTAVMFMLASSGCQKADNSRISYSAAETPSAVQSAEGGLQEKPQNIQQSAAPELSIHQSETQAEKSAESSFSFADIADRGFSFSSGAGAWSTELFISQDGSFEGLYHDSNMGDSSDAYPGGTIYICSFKGRFDHLEQVDAFTFKMNLASLEFEQEPGKEEIADDVRYIYSTAYGLDDGNEFYLYLPGSKLAQLPEEYRGWVGYYNLEGTTETELPFYGLYNIKAGNGFSSYEYKRQSLSERIAEEISLAETQGAEIDAKLQNLTSQGDMNMASAELFRVWDDALNVVWRMLESELDSERMESLRIEERKWIADKEEQIKAAGQEFEGGSFQPTAESTMAAQLTRERVYELAKYAEAVNE